MPDSASIAHTVAMRFARNQRSDYACIRAAVTQALDAYESELVAERADR